MSVPCRLVMSRLWPTYGREHLEPPTADLPLISNYTQSYHNNKTNNKTSSYHAQNGY